MFQRWKLYLEGITNGYIVSGSIIILFFYMNIYIGNLNFKIKESSLQEKLEEFGEVISARIIKDRETGRSKGFGFVEMANDDEARRAIETLNDTEFEGRKMIIKEALPR